MTHYGRYVGGGRMGGGRGGGYGAPPAAGLTSRLTPTVLYLIVANAAVFFLSIFLRDYVLAFMALKPSTVFPGAQVWRVVTYMFTHVEFSHFFFNMLALFFFGPPLEQVWGQRKFLIYYFLTGVGAGIVCVPFYLAMGSDVPIIGASGAIFGLFAAFALIYPNAIVYVMFILPVKAKYLVVFFVFIEFAATASFVGGSSVAHVAHLSGAVIGYFYLRRHMDLKAFYLRRKLAMQKRRQRADAERELKKRGLDVIPGGDNADSRDDYRSFDDGDERGPWLH